MSQTLTKADADGILKTVFLQPFRDTLNNTLSPTYSQIERGSKNISAGKLRFSIETGRSGGTGSIGELDDLPEADRQKSTVVNLGLKNHYGRIKITGQLMELATSDDAVFINAVEREMSGIQKDLMQERQRQTWNDLDSALVYASGAHVANVIPLGAASPSQMRSLVAGSYVDIGTSAAPTSVATKVLIDSIDRGNKTITIVGTLGAVINGSVIRKANSFGKELTGIRAIVGKGDVLFGLDGAAEYVWNSYESENGGALRNLNSLMLQTAMDEMFNEHGTQANLCVTSHGVMRSFGANIDDRQRFVGDVDLKDGYTGIQVFGGDNTSVLMADRFAPENELYMLSTEDLYFNEASDWNWMQDDGAILARIPDKDGYTATMRKYDELTSDQRNGHGVIRDLNIAAA